VIAGSCGTTTAGSALASGIMFSDGGGLTVAQALDNKLSTIGKVERMTSPSG
jgi:hypothetical protein